MLTLDQIQNWLGLYTGYTIIVKIKNLTSFALEDNVNCRDISGKHSEMDEDNFKQRDFLL